jgi:hypothetical protein
MLSELSNWATSVYNEPRGQDVEALRNKLKELSNQLFKALDDKFGSYGFELLMGLLTATSLLAMLGVTRNSDRSIGFFGAGALLTICGTADQRHTRDSR